MKRPSTLVMCLVGALLLSTSLIGLAAVSHEPQTVDRAAAAPAFRVLGRVRGLYPGVRTSMRVRVWNLEPFPIVVRRVRPIVHPAAPGCPAVAVHIRRFRGRTRIPAHGTVRLELRVRMRATASNACMGARWPISYRGRATRR